MYCCHECYEGEFNLGDWHGKSIDLPRLMFMPLSAVYNSSDLRGSVPFTEFFTELLKRNGIHIPLYIIKIKQEKPIGRYSLT